MKFFLISLDVPYDLENAAYLIGNALSPFQFIGTLHEVTVLRGLARDGVDGCAYHAWWPNWKTNSRI